MPQKSQLRVNKILSNVSVKYSNPELIWDKVFPPVMVKKDSDYYRVYDRNFRIPETKRNSRGVAREHTFESSLASYSLEKHALKDIVHDDDKENYDEADLEVDTTEHLTEALYRRLELTVSSLFTTTNWSLNVSLAAGAAFTSNTMTSDPVLVFDTAGSVQIDQSGRKPNFGIIPRASYLAIKSHIAILDRIKYTSSEVTSKVMGALFDLGEILVPSGSYDSAPQGAAASLVRYYDNICFSGYKPQSPGIKTPSAGYVFMKQAPRVKQWREEEVGGDWVECEVKYSPKVVASLCGYLIKGSV